MIVLFSWSFDSTMIVFLNRTNNRLSFRRQTSTFLLAKGRAF